MSATQYTPRPVKLSPNQRLVLRGMVDKSQGIFYLTRLYDVSRGSLQRKGLIVFNADRGMYEVTQAGRDALGPKEWAVDVFEMRDGESGRRHVATQLFFSEWEAKNYARANTCELGSTRNWSDVRPANPDEKEFA